MDLDKDGEKIIESITIINRHMQEGKTDSVEGLKAISKLLQRYNSYLKVWNDGRVEALNDKYYN